MAGRAEVAALAGKSQQIFMPAVRTFDTSETMVQITTVKITVDNLLGVGAEESIFFAKLLIVDLFKGLEVVFNTLVVLRVLGFSGMI
jgi:hypothetical protein